MRANVSYALRLKLPLGCDFGIKWRCNERAGAGGGNGKGIQKKPPAIRAVFVRQLTATIVCAAVAVLVFCSVM